MNASVFYEGTSPYVIVPSSLIESGNGDAVLIYCFLVNFPDGWPPMRGDMMQAVGGSRSRYEKGARLLREQGYLYKVPIPLPERGNRFEFRFNPFASDAVTEVQP